MMGWERLLCRARAQAGLLLTLARSRALGSTPGWAIVLGGTLGSCCVAPPSYEEVLDFGFGTPEQAFESFRTGVRADSFVLEYRCFSSGWKQRNGASLQAYVAFRDQLMAENRFLRKGLADMEIRSVEPIGRGRALVHAETHGRWVSLALVRNDYLEVYIGDELYGDEAVQDLLADEVIVRQEGRLWGRIDLDQLEVAKRFEDLSFDQVAEQFSRVTLGREWKIDDFAVADAPPNP